MYLNILDEVRFENLRKFYGITTFIASKHLTSLDLFLLKIAWLGKYSD